MSLALRDSDDDTRTIAITGKFNFDLHREFRNAYIDSPARRKFVLDLRETDYLDSSALGMILLLREYLNEDDNRFRIINCNQEIRNIFAISNIDKIIRIG